MKGAGYAFIIIGILLTISSSGLHFYSYLIAIAGTVIVAAHALLNRDEKSTLCRIGYHKYKQIGWDNEITSRVIYKCERCDQIKKVMRTV